MRIVMTKEALLEVLAGQLKAAKIEDKRLTDEHVNAENARLKRFRENLRAALKWDYAAAKKADFRIESDWNDRIVCPIRNEALIARVIKNVQLDERKGPIYLQEGTDEHAAATWVPEAERISKSICE